MLSKYKYRLWKNFKSQTVNMLQEMPDEFDNAKRSISMRVRWLRKDLEKTNDPIERQGIEFMIKILEDFTKLKKGKTWIKKD